MRYLLDTNVLSHFARGDSAVLNRLKATQPSQIAVSVITVMEVEYGLRLNPDRVKKLAPVMQALLDSLTAVEFSREDALAAAGVRVSLRARGLPIGSYDLLLAGCALSRGLILVTSNTREFRRVAGLQIEDWRR